MTLRPKKLTQAQNKLQSLDPADPGYAQAEAAVEQAGKEATEAKEALDKATDATVKAGTDAKAKAEKADNILTKFQGTANAASQNQVSQGEQDNLSNVARLTMLMAMFIEIVGKKYGRKPAKRSCAFQRLAGRASGGDGKEIG
ncbi:pathogenicity island 1 effector protein [Salmonella sp. NCTC 11881]|nr:pathogenicity island 1 effector protein [Salmonella sp. NCTC 11881]